MKDKLWKAILQEIVKLGASEEGPQSVRSPYYGNDQGGVCYVSYVDKAPGTYRLFHVSARVDHLGDVSARVEGPYYDYSVQYWEHMARSDAMHPYQVIVTEDWVHMTFGRDLKEGDRDLAGHGGAEFQFEIESLAIASALQVDGFDIRQHKDEYKEGEQIKWILTSRNVWYQGPIPEPMRHLFKVNAKKVSL